MYISGMLNQCKSYDILCNTLYTIVILRCIIRQKQRNIEEDMKHVQYMYTWLFPKIGGTSKS